MTITVLSGPDREKNYGDCFLIDDDSTLYVYDCGSEELANNVIDYMNQKGCSKAIAILSHNDADHFNGIKFLVDKGKISAVYTVCLLKYVDEILELCDGRKTENSVRKQILDRYDNIAQLGGYLIDIYPLNQKLSENISIVGPEKNYMLKAVAHELNSLEGDTIDNETVVNATSVQVEITFNDNKKILLCGDCSFEAVENKINNYNIIQLPHHGKIIQASFFKRICDSNFSFVSKKHHVLKFKHSPSLFIVVFISYYHISTIFAMQITPLHQGFPMGAVLFFGGIILRGLGERLNGIQEVSGSIPLISTTGSSSFIFLPAQIEWVFFVSKLSGCFLCVGLSMMCYKIESKNIAGGQEVV